jgi:nucleoside 2-deoxyribosyltransferase
MTIVYLAGGMKDGWQDKFISKLPNCLLLDPRSWSSPDPKVYTARDLANIRKADVVLVYMSSSNPSGFGLSVELGYAYGLGKRIVFVDNIKEDWRTVYFGMHREMATVRVNNIDEAIEAIWRG